MSEWSDGEGGVGALHSASRALDEAGVDHWFFGGWAVDLWVGRLTRPHDDIDVLVWRRDEPAVDAALEAAGWRHTPSPEDLLGTSYVREGHELQLTFVVPGADASVLVPVPQQPIVVSTAPLDIVRRELDGVSVRVLPLDVMLATKSTPRPDDVGGRKDRADLAALRAVADGGD